MAKSDSSVSTDHRVSLNIKNALFVAVIYVAIFVVMQKISKVSYTDVAETSDNFRKFAVYPLFAGAFFLTLVGFWTGWIHDVWRDKFKIKHHGWILLLPIIVFVMAMATISEVDFASKNASFVALLVIGSILVGYCEELLFRGYILQGSRGSGMTEGKVMLTVMTTFGLFHGLNLLTGQDLKTTIQQIFFAFVFGGIFFIIFRKPGYLLLPMFLHGLWDFSTFITGTPETNLPGVDPSPAMLVKTVSQFVLVIVFLAAIKQIKVPAKE
jgi:membrane protease YdiL (CAAX protease family)